MSNAARIETLRKMVLSALEAASEADHWTRQALASGKELAASRKGAEPFGGLARLA